MSLFVVVTVWRQPAGYSGRTGRTRWAGLGIRMTSQGLECRSLASPWTSDAAGPDRAQGAVRPIGSPLIPPARQWVWEALGSWGHCLVTLMPSQPQVWVSAREGLSEAVTLPPWEPPGTKYILKIHYLLSPLAYFFSFGSELALRW